MRGVSLKENVQAFGSSKLIQFLAITVFFGNTAAISFLGFLQQIWRTYIEPNSFTEDLGTQKMLEAELPRTQVHVINLDAAEQRCLVECYLHAVSIFLF